MADRDLHDTFQPRSFPFEFARQKIGSSLAASLRQLELEAPPAPHSNFGTAINVVLVWCGARTASLPAWNYCDMSRVVEFIDNLNKISTQVSTKMIEDVVILERPQVYRNGERSQQELIARKNSHRILWRADGPIGDDQIGRELDMFDLNVDLFAGGYIMGKEGFSIWEVATETLLYAEAWREDCMSPAQLKEFIVHCERMVSVWNSSMEKLGLPYRFYGSLDWGRREVAWSEAVRTKRLCGKEFIGCDSRAKDYGGGGGRVNIRIPSVRRHGPVGQSVSAAA